MKIQEADAKSLLVAQGLPVPPWDVAHTAAEARAAAERFLADGPPRQGRDQGPGPRRRPRQGRRREARRDPRTRLRRVAGEILALEIKGIPVRKVLVGPAADIVKEYYLSAVLDRAGRQILLMGSSEGGVEIEQVAAERPRRSSRSPPIRYQGLLAWQARADGVPPRARRPT